MMDFTTRKVHLFIGLLLFFYCLYFVNQYYLNIASSGYMYSMANEHDSISFEVRASNATKTNHGSNIEPFFRVDVHNSVRICTQEERKQYIQHKCSIIKNKEQKNRSFVVSHEHKLVFCDVPKAASTTWESGMALSTSIGKAYHAKAPIENARIHRISQSLKYGLSRVSLSELHTLKGYTTFAVVRHPFDRAESAYTDKMFCKGFFKKYQQEVKDNFRDQDTLMTDPVSFAEFVRYLTEGYSDNPHWRSYTTDCNPCALNFDYILRVETMEHDAPYILSIMNQAKDFLHSHKSNVRRQATNVSENIVSPKYLELFESIDLDHTKWLQRKYKLDFEQYGYFFNYNKKLATCQVTLPSGEVCC